MLHMERQDLAEIVAHCHESLKIGGILYISSKYGEYREIEVENFGDREVLLFVQTGGIGGSCW
jgi:predicted SAM-dependent methyltransferase